MDADDLGKTAPATVEADEKDARAGHTADRMPTSEEEASAERSQVDPDVARSYEEATERGANVKGEGQI